MAINNLNPRRTVWFSPHEPSNKYDIWLSKNAHLDENGEPTTDSNAQRDCDYIFKIYDCGQWNPIVGFNSTAKYKINTVASVEYQYIYNNTSYTSTGIQQFHLPLFRGPEDSPAELFDAGELGDALNKFVTDEQWGTIYDSHLKTVIEQYPFNLWPAASSTLGGVWADRFAISHSDTSTASKTWMAQCKYKYNAPNNYNLYIHAKDIISAINTYTTDNPLEPGIQPGSDFEWRLATYEDIGGIRCQTDTTDQDYRGLPVVFGGPNAGLTYSGNTPDGLTLYGDSLTYNSDNSFLYIPGWALVDWLKNPTGNETPTPFISGWRGIDTQLRTGNDTVWVGLQGLIDDNIGKVPMAVVDANDPSGMNIEWVDLPTVTQYTGINLIKVNNSEIGIDITTNVPTDGSFIIYDDGVVKWSNAPMTSYTPGKGIDITSGVISQNITYFESENTDTVYTAQIDYASARDTFQITYDNSDTETVNIYQVFDFGDITLNSSVDYSITQMPKWANPVYFILRNVKSVSLANNQETINMPAGFSGEDYLVTIQFGIIKFEEIEVTSI